MGKKNSKKNPFVGKHLPTNNNSTKATRLPNSGKKKPSAQSEPRETKAEKRGKRSVLGYLFGVAVSVVSFGWSVYQHTVKVSNDRRILDSMRRRPLKFTEHGACRMDCRYISKDDVHQTLQVGRINERKSEPTSKPCAKYVVDADVKDGSKQVQAVFAACSRETRVITVIDKSTDWECGPC